MSENLDDILDGNDAEPPEETPPTDETPPAEETPPEEPAVEAEGDKPAEEAKPDVSPASVENKVDDEVTALRAELARIRAKNRDMEEANQQAQPPVEKPDFFEDPDGALQNLEHNVDQKITRVKIDMSESQARARHEDFDDKAKTFSELAAENPALWNQMAADPDPAEFAYKYAKETTRLKEVGNIDEFEARIRAEEQAKYAEMEKRLKALEAGDTPLPGSLSDTRATGGNSPPSVGNESLDDVVGADASHR